MCDFLSVDPVVEQTVQKLIEKAGRLVANRSALSSGVTAPYGTIDDTGRVELSQDSIRERVFDVQKNNQVKNNFTGVPDTDPRACFTRSTWSPAINMQQPPL